MAHIRTYVNNTVSQVWADWGSVSTASLVEPILHELALATRCQNIHAFVGRIPGEDKKMVDATSWLTHIPDRIFLSYYRTNFL